MDFVREETKAVGREEGKWAYSARESTVPQIPGLQGVHPSAYELLLLHHLYIFHFKRDYFEPNFSDLR